jgi:hypothetical protein
MNCQSVSASLIRTTVCVTGGWGEKELETENCQSSEQAPKNAQSPSRLVHALLGAFGLEQENKNSLHD